MFWVFAILIGFFALIGVWAFIGFVSWSRGFNEYNQGRRMSWKLSKSRAELIEAYEEIFVDNAPRYKHPLQWHHLYVDAWVSFFGMNYTLGHVVAIGLPTG